MQAIAELTQQMSIHFINLIHQFSCLTSNEA